MEEQRTILEAKKTTLIRRGKNDAWFHQEIAAVQKSFVRYGSFEDIPVQHRSAVTVRSPEHQDNVLLQAGTNPMNRTPILQDEDEIFDETGTAPFAAADDSGPRVVPPDDPAFVTGHMAQHSGQHNSEQLQLVHEFLEAQNSIFNTSGFDTEFATSLMPQLPAQNFIPRNHRYGQQPSFSDSGYRSSSNGQGGVNDIQSSGPSAGEEFFLGAYDQNLPVSHSAEAMGTQQFINLADVEKRRSDMRHRR